MGTRSNIIYEEPSGEVLSMYCHYDGYPDNNGRILLDQYNSAKKAKALIEIGYARSLKPKIMEVEPKRTGVPEHYRSLTSYMWSVDAVTIEYIYRWSKDEDEWSVSESKRIKPSDSYIVRVAYHTYFKRLHKIMMEVDKEINLVEDKRSEMWLKGG